MLRGRPFEFVNDELRARCRLYIGGREEFGQNVSAILVEVSDDKQIGAIILGTPFDPKRPVERGNELASLSAFVRSMIPEANIRKIVGEQSIALATGGGAVKDFGKASVRLAINTLKKEFTVVIIVTQ